jgi:hypothetical protein
LNQCPQKQGVCPRVSTRTPTSLIIQQRAFHGTAPTFAGGWQLFDVIAPGSAAAAASENDGRIFEILTGARWGFRSGPVAYPGWDSPSPSVDPGAVSALGELPLASHFPLVPPGMSLAEYQSYCYQFF